MCSVFVRKEDNMGKVEGEEWVLNGKRAPESVLVSQSP